MGRPPNFEGRIGEGLCWQRVGGKNRQSNNKRLRLVTLNARDPGFELLPVGALQHEVRRNLHSIT